MYCTCFTRVSYGAKHCANDRLPAEKLEQAVTGRLWKVLNDGDLINEAIEETYARMTERTGEQTSEHEAVQRKLTETRAAMDRYFRAFDNATMPEDICAPRIAALGEQAKALEGRAAELAAAADDDTEQPERVTPADLDALRHELRAALEHNTAARAKTVLHSHDRRNPRRRTRQDRTAFRVPAVREPCCSMGETALCANHALMNAPVVGVG